MFRRTIWHLGPGRRRRGWRRHFRAIRKIARLSPERLSAWREQALEAHLAWARKNVPLHASHAADPKRLGDWPILSRDTLQTHLDDLRDHSRPVEELQINASGGSTGEPVRFYQDADYWTFEHANDVWLDILWGVRPWTPTLTLWGIDDPDEQGWKAKLEARLLRAPTVDVFQLDEAKLDEVVDRLARERYPVILGYVSALDALAQHVEKRGGLPYKPKLVRSAAEALDDVRRQRIESALGVRVTDLYGSRESASMAAQCREGRYHVLEHGRILEIVDERGRPAPPGEMGRVLVTDLSNRAFGLIRYENGDVSAWAEDTACDCGLAYPILERIHGRTSDFILTPKGDRIHGEWFSHLFYDEPRVKRFQVRQRDLRKVELLTVGAADERNLSSILLQIRARLGPEVEFDWRRVAEIPLTKSGKHRFTISEVPYL